LPRLDTIGRDLHVSRTAVRKIPRSGETDFSRERERLPMPRIGPWQGQLERVLSSEANMPAQERLTPIRIFEVEERSAIGPSTMAPAAPSGSIRRPLRWISQQASLRAEDRQAAVRE
jgi:hypothetical protein